MRRTCTITTVAKKYKKKAKLHYKLVMQEFKVKQQYKLVMKELIDKHNNKVIRSEKKQMLMADILPEVRELILKELNKIKLRKRTEMGWDQVHEELYNAPYCEKQRQITEVVACRKCHVCEKSSLCAACYKNGELHYLEPCQWPDVEYVETITKYL